MLRFLKLPIKIAQPVRERERETVEEKEIADSEYTHSSHCNHYAYSYKSLHTLLRHNIIN